jgi:hypothetical protein
LGSSGTRSWRRSSTPSGRPRSSSKGGDSTPTPCGRTAPWAIGPRRPRRDPGPSLLCLPDRS